MRELFKDNLRGGFLLGVISFVLVKIKLPLLPVIGIVIGIIAFIKSLTAVRAGKMLGLFGVLVSLIPIIIGIATLFFIYYLLVSYLNHLLFGR